MARAFSRVISYESSGSRKGPELAAAPNPRGTSTPTGACRQDLGCVLWTVNTQDRTIRVEAIADSPGGTKSMELDDWLTFDDLDSDHCG